MTHDELMTVDGGDVTGFLVGVVATTVIDGVLKEETGKGLGDWGQMGYSKAKEAWKEWEEIGGGFGLLVDAIGW